MNESRSSITQYGYAALLLALVAALFGLRLDGDGGKSAVKAAAEKKAADKAESARQGGRAKSHREFVEGYFRPPALVPNCEGSASRPWPRPEEADNTDVLIVSVADPVATPFGCWFDQAVSAVMRAAANVNYAPASHWFPWEADPQSKLQDPPLPFETCPGVVVFRDNDRANRFLLVLLVGETPNSIRARPLGAALDLAYEVDSNRTTPRDDVRLVAPYFSGAERGLLEALERWAGRPGNEVTFNIISGSANGLDLKLPREVLGSDARYSLRSTVVPIEYQQEAALQFLKEHRVGNSLEPNKSGDKRDDGDVALLVESNSGFGQARLKEQLPEERATSQPLYLPYPMHLSRVRARQEERRLERERRYNPDVIGTENGTSRLRFLPGPETIPNLDEATTPRLVDRSVEDITAAIRRHHIRHVGLLVTDPQDVVYFIDRIKRDCPDVDCFVTGMDLSYALPENRYSMRGVVIASSYPLFPPNQGWTEPSGRVRETFPNESAQGCYNATVVHLAELAGPRSRDGDGAGRRWRALREYGPPLFARTAQNEGRPPVWVFSVGENGRYVPHGVSFYDPAGIKVGEHELMAVGPQPHVNGRWVPWPALGTFAVPAVALLAGAAAAFVAVTRGRWAMSGVPSSAAFPPRERRGLARAWHWLAAPPGKAEASVSFWQSLTLTIVVVALAPLFFTLSLLLGRPFVVYPLKADYLLVAAAAALTGVLILLALAFQARCLGRLLRAAFRPARSGPEAWLSGLGVLFCVGAGVAVVFHFLVLAWASEQAERVLFVERAVNMTTGFSVLPPLAVLAGGVVSLALSALKRRYLGRRFHVRCPYPRPKSHDTRFDPMTARACADLNGLSQHLHKELTSLAVFCRRRWRWVLLAAGIYVVGAWLILDRYRRTPEGDFWDLLFVSGFTVLAGGVVLNLVRFLACWKDLETLLKRVALLPMVRAFDRLPRKAADLFGGYFLTRRPRGTHLVIPLHLLRQLRADVRASASTPERPESAGLLSPAEPALARMPTFDDSPAHIAEDLAGGAAWPSPLGPRAEGEFPAPPLNRLSQDARTLVGELARYWPHHSVADAFGEAAPAEGDEKKGAATEKAMPSWVRTAEDFVAIQVIIFLSQFFIQLWVLAKSLVWASVALLLAATVYPFQPERLILSLQFALLLAVSGSILWVLTRVNKDEVISRVTRSTPNKFDLNWDFTQKTLLFLGPIALVLLASVSGRLRALVEPFLDMIR